MIRQPFYILKNTIQHYDWGSTTALPELLGQPNPEAKPMAEMWMGAHPKAPSLLLMDRDQISFADAITRDPEVILGPRVSSHYHGQFPFLMKVLAASEPLSIQAHPNAEVARVGFERENQAGIPITSGARVYQDPNHKPELLCAIQPFSLMCGFQDPNLSATLLQELGIEPLSAIAQKLMQPDGLRYFYEAMLHLAPEVKQAIALQAAEKASSLARVHPGYEWLKRLAMKHPKDIAILSPLLMNLGRLMPGEAIFLPCGMLHAYLEGLGVEIMANSDNVLRGGLTSKHIAMDELRTVVDFTAGPLPLVQPHSISPGEMVYKTSAQEFELSLLRVGTDAEISCGASDSPEILFCAKGQAIIATAGEDKTWELRRGQSIFITATAPQLILRGDAEIFRAKVPVCIPES